VTPDEQAALLRDFLYSIPDGANWPAVGDEANSALVDPNAVRLQAAAEGEEAAEEPAAPAPPDDTPGG
jgi:hypothetical protein